MVGCPVRRREFVAEQWVDHVAQATVHAGIHDADLSFVFVSNPDDPTNEILDKTASIYNIRTTFVNDAVENAVAVKRQWTHNRIRTMVRVRNMMLEAVREEAPDLFLSLDSDILIHRQGILAMFKMFEHVGRYGRKPTATSHCVYLDAATTQYPNYAHLGRNGQMVRAQHRGELIGVDVIMAAKLMTPQAYAIDYTFDHRGEDIAWSIAAREAGNVLGWTGNIVSKHIMNPEELDRLDDRCGY